MRVSPPLQTCRPSYAVAIGIFALCAIGYAYLFFSGISDRFFNPRWTTDDSLQQVYPFWEAVYPGFFQGDLITEVMKGYLAPIHYILGMSITRLTRDPMMTAHWMHAIQLSGALFFTFLAVRRFAGTPAAFFAVMWLMHTRPIMQRLTSGLPRGWAAFVIAIFLYFFLTKNYKAVFLVLLMGCLLHPPTTMICGVSFSLWLLCHVIFSPDRSQYVKPFIALVLLTPVYALVTFSVVQRPAHIGSMVTIAEARDIPEFQFPGGRFPFVPLQDLRAEVNMYAYQAFINRFHRGFSEATAGSNFRPHPFLREHGRNIIVALTGILLLFAITVRSRVVPSQLWFFLLGTSFVYLASRELAFLLYVPNRHLQFPMAFFFIFTFSIGFWNLGKHLGHILRLRRWPVLSSVLLALIGVYIYLNSGDGLRGDLNFNYTTDKRGWVFAWLRQNTPEDAVIAGHPTFIDGMMLFAKRRGFITTETYHPFYPKYNLEARRRVDISLRAHYAQTLEEMWEILKDERIDYFVLERARFLPESLVKNTYQLPHRELAAELGSRPWTDYAFRQMPREIDLDSAPYQVFRDDRSVVIDVAELARWLEQPRFVLEVVDVEEFR